tara:strand:- start:2452 stop:3906 length:1455 start_codon:yes stop_codon:yes gene_type:complete
MLRAILIFLTFAFAYAVHDSNLQQIAIQVTSDGEKGWLFSGYSGPDPAMTLQRGIKYVFMMNAPHYQLTLEEHEKPHIIIGQSQTSGMGNFAVVFDNSMTGTIRYYAKNAIWMHGDITLTGDYEKPAPDTSGLYPSPHEPASPLPSPSPTPTPTPSTPVCCEAVTAQCEACKLGWSVDKYCHYFPSEDGCPIVTNYCCKALIASCLSCELNMDVATYCVHNPDIEGCEFGGPPQEVNSPSVGSRITLDLDFSSIGTSGTHLRNMWTTLLINELSVLMGISKDRITIDRVSPGSIIVDFSVHDGPDNELSPEQALELLNTMVLNTASSLWTSNYLNILPAANRIKSWPLPQVINAPMDPPPPPVVHSHGSQGVHNHHNDDHPADHTHDQPHTDDNADHHHHGSDDPNDHTHDTHSHSSSTNANDDDDDTDITWWVVGIGGGLLVIMGIIFFVYESRNGVMHKTVVHRVARDDYSTPYQPITVFKS